ncbi:MAG: hypothetical protein QOK48_1252, partial [Blastocatellia bacterium]|nr:hypothetical protein [Blastocatellia bacterium]
MIPGGVVQNFSIGLTLADGMFDRAPQMSFDGHSRLQPARGSM